MQPLRLCVFLAFIAVLRCYELSQNLAEFYCVLNGKYSDREQEKKDGVQRTLMDLSFQPVLAPALSPIPVVYLEQYDNGVLVPPYILIVTEREDGIVLTTQYNFSGNTQVKPGTFDANQIKLFTMEDLQQRDCKTANKRLEPFAFIYKEQDCRAAEVNGERQSDGSIATCNKLTAVTPVGAAEKPTVVPYQIRRHGNKFPLEGAPSNYVCDCDNTSD